MSLFTMRFPRLDLDKISFGTKQWPKNIRNSTKIILCQFLILSYGFWNNNNFKLSSISTMYFSKGH